MQDLGIEGIRLDAGTLLVNCPFRSVSTMIGIGVGHWRVHHPSVFWLYRTRKRGSASMNGLIGEPHMVRLGPIEVIILSKGGVEYINRKDETSRHPFES